MAMRPLDKVFAIEFATVYPLYVEKVERKHRTRARSSCRSEIDAHHKQRPRQNGRYSGRDCNRQQRERNGAPLVRQRPDVPSHDLVCAPREEHVGCALREHEHAFPVRRIAVERERDDFATVFAFSDLELLVPSV